MSKRWFALSVLLVCITGLAACESSTAPPQYTPGERAAATPLPPMPTAVPWPPDRLVFAHLEKIWLAEGAPPYALTIGDRPVLSPDGQRVAYFLPDEANPEYSQIYVLDVASGGIFLVSGPPAAYTPPVWSPDSQSLAYVNNDVLVVTDARGEVQRALATDVGAVGEGPIRPAWSADGQTIVCPLTRLGPPDLFALQVEDGAAVQVSHTGGYAASAPYVLLADDTTVASQDTVLYTNLSDGGTLWAAGIDGGGRRRVLSELSHVVERMLLSPDARRIAGFQQSPGEETYRLWVIDLTTEMLQRGDSFESVPDPFFWSEDSRTLYWIAQERLYSYTPASGAGGVLAELPAPTPTPTATPLPVARQLLYYDAGGFYQAEPYGEAELVKEIPASMAASSGYTTREGVVAFSYESSVYVLQLQAGVPRSLYAFQEEDLVGIELAWSNQGNYLLCATTYSQEEGTSLGFRVELSLLRVQPPGLERVAYFTDRTGVTPLSYDEETGLVVVLPRGGDPSFVRLEVYDGATGELRQLLPVEGEGTAALSPDLHWAASTGYDGEAGHGVIYLYDLAGGEMVSRTYALPDGTFTWGPLRWSPDGAYLAFVPMAGDPYGAEQPEPRGIWVLQPETLQSIEVVPLESPTAILVGWR